MRHYAHTIRIAAPLLLAPYLVGCPDSTEPQPGPNELAFSVQPSDALAGEGISPAVEIEIRNASGVLATDARTRVTLSFGSNPGDARLMGTTTVNAVGGIAIFPGLALDKAGTGFTLVATAEDVDPATSDPFSIAAAQSARLAFLAQPALTGGKDVITPAVQVAIQDEFGNTVPSATDVVGVSLETNPGGATLSGTLDVAAVAGVATFSDLRIDLPGQGYKLRAVSGSLPAAASVSFDVSLTFIALTAGFDHTCGITSTGSAYCWGENSEGQLGVGTEEDIRLRPNPVVGDHVFIDISAGGEHTCAVTPDGDAYCWGENNHGRLGDATEIDRTIPVRVDVTGLRFAQISAGGSDHTCAVAENGDAYCWGDNSDGQLGDRRDSGFESLTPVMVVGGHLFDHVSSGRSHTCGLDRTGGAHCWGDNFEGQLGEGPGSPFLRDEPVPVSGGITFSNIHAGRIHSCGITPSGESYCWGSNARGQLGLGAGFGGKFLEPARAAVGLLFSQLSAAHDHTCGVIPTGDAYCWGEGDDGQLGNGSNTDSDRSVLVQGSHAFSLVAAGDDHTCGITITGETYCWGDNRDGQLGDGTQSDSPVPVRVIQ